MKEKIFLIYQITNLLDNRIYVGCHFTYNLNDCYMGSSQHLKKDIKKFGRENFKKEILFVYDNKEEMLTKEKELVTKEFCMREDTYNRIEGGGYCFMNIGMATVRDKQGNTFNVYCDDSRYLSGELVHINTGRSMTPETKAAINKTRKGIPMSEDAKKQISKTLKEKYAAGEKIGAWGTKRSEESKIKASEKRKQAVVDGKDLRAKEIDQYDLEGNLIKTWDSIGQIVKTLNSHKSNIIQVCKGNKKTAKGFIWKYHTTVI